MPNQEIYQLKKTIQPIEMMSQSKENIPDNDKYAILKSTRRNSTFSSSACKQLIISMCEDSSINEKNTRLQQNIKQIKLQETVNVLQKKIGRQIEEINTLTHDFNALNKIKIQQLSQMEEQIQKVKKNTIDKSQHLRILNEVKKKNMGLESLNKELKDKNMEVEKKIMKLKEILRKKEISLSDLKGKVQNDRSNSLQEIIIKQRQELSSLKQKYLKAKQNETKLQKQNQVLKTKVSQHKFQNTNLKTQTLNLEQYNKRLSHQHQSLQKEHQQCRKQSSALQSTMKQTITTKNDEITKLRETVQKIQIIQRQNEAHQFSQIYKQEISLVLKNNIIDRNTRNKVQKIMYDILHQMEQSMNRILMQVVVTNL